MHKNPKILFIVKRRELVDDYGNVRPVCSPNGEEYNLYGELNSSGLYNSVRFVVQILQHVGVNAHLAQVVDNNCIDKEVTKHKPDIVVIEALWVVPEKFEILHKLHKHVQWLIRLHSEIPFLSFEGMSIDWLFKYAKSNNNISISANSERMVRELQPLLKTKIFYTPNMYPTCGENFNKEHRDPRYIDIGCFGAIRPLKNQLIQAISAIEFADKHDKILRFHINATRIEGKADPILRNIRFLFEHTAHQLVEHKWMNHEDFINVIRHEIDMGMQVSFSETYNIVSADLVDNNIPIVTSKEVQFVLPIFHADPTNSKDIIDKLDHAWLTSKIDSQYLNKELLKHMNKVALEDWFKVLREI